MWFLKKKKQVFGSDIEAQCAYCRYNQCEPEEDKVACVHKGNGVCKKYEYDPLKREPKGVPKLRRYTPEDFSL